MLTVLTGDALGQLRTLPDESVQCCVTSPPYWGLRDYSTEGQLGLEKTPEEYVAKMVEVFREVRRVLRKDGTLWLNLGDSYASAWPAPNTRRNIIDNPISGGKRGQHRPERMGNGLKEKDLCGIPWRVAFALQDDGWWLRSDIIWAKPNPMPESVTDRPTKSHEYLFLLTKSASYYYDAEAIKEKNCVTSEWVEPAPRLERAEVRNGLNPVKGQVGFYHLANPGSGRNKRSVWTVATAPYPEAHFATYPPDLIKPCILAGTSAKGCCAKCGAPWERKISVDYIKNRPSAGNDPRSRDADRLAMAREIYGSQGWRGNNLLRDTQTLGWKPTCKCCEEKVSIDDTEMDKPGQNGEANAERSKGGDDERMDSAKNVENFMPEVCPVRVSSAAPKVQSSGAAIIPCTILDPFAGSGTTGMVALELGRKAVLIELNPKYCELIEQRCNVTLGLKLA